MSENEWAQTGGLLAIGAFQHMKLGEAFMDRTYKEDIPSTRRALEKLKKEFSGVASTTDWTKLRIEPLLAHVNFLGRLLR